MSLIEIHIKRHRHYFSEALHEAFKEIPLHEVFEIKVKDCNKKNRKRLRYALMVKRNGKFLQAHGSIDHLIHLAIGIYPTERKRLEIELDNMLLGDNGT